MLARGRNFWESAPVNTEGRATLKTQAYRVPVPPLVTYCCLSRRLHNFEVNKQEKDKEDVQNSCPTPPVCLISTLQRLARLVIFTRNFLRCSVSAITANSPGLKKKTKSKQTNKKNKMSTVDFAVFAWPYCEKLNYTEACVIIICNIDVLCSHNIYNMTSELLIVYQREINPSCLPDMMSFTW